jgi:hypothetical protein
MSTHVGFMGYNKRFQKHRKLFHSVFSKAQNYTFEGTQTKAAQVLVKDLIEAQIPEAYDGIVRRLACFAHQRRIAAEVCFCHPKVCHDSRHEDCIWLSDYVG